MAFVIKLYDLCKVNEDNTETFVAAKNNTVDKWRGKWNYVFL